MKSVPDLDIGPEELKLKQKADELLKRIWTDKDEDPEVNTYHINMLKRYYLRESPTEPAFNGSRVSSNSDDNDVINTDQDVDHKAASVACVIEEEVSDEAMSLPLYNSHQSAYCEHHSTETALLYIHDYLISAVGSQKISCLCLLDLSAAFNTIDHDTLITRLSSWFDIRGSVLSWFKSYLVISLLSCKM